MKKDSFKTLSLIIIIFILIFFLVFGLFLKIDLKSNFYTVLLNPKYKKNINYIEIQDNSSPNSEIIKLYEQKSIWYVKNKEGLVLPADIKKINQFLSCFEKKRLVSVLTQSVDKWDEYSIEDNSACRLRIGQSNGGGFLFYTDLFIGNLSLDESMIHFRTQKNVRVLQTSSDFIEYLSTKKEFWADTFIISKQSDISENSITELSYTDYVTAHTLILDNSVKKFNNTINALLTAQGSCFFSEQVLVDCYKVNTISVLERGNELIYIETYRKQTSFEDIKYYLKIKNKRINIQITQEISSWIYEKIVNSFIDIK